MLYQVKVSGSLPATEAEKEVDEAIHAVAELGCEITAGDVKEAINTVSVLILP